MKYHFLGLFVAFLTIQQVYSQNTLSIEWQYTLGGSNMDWGKKALCTPQGDYVFLGDVTPADASLPPAIGNHDIIR